jgi:hypothetical protein
MILCLEEIPQPKVAETFNFQRTLKIRNHLCLHPFRSIVPIGTDAYISSSVPLLLYSFFDTKTYNLLFS